MGDVKCGHTGIADRFLDRGQNVDLRGHIERRGRFVEDDQVGFRHQRHHRHRPLQLPAGHLMRITATEIVGIRQAKAVEKIDGAAFGFFGIGNAMFQRGLDDLFHQLLGRVEGGGGRLGHVSHLFAAQSAKAARAALHDVATVQKNLSARNAHATPAIAHRRQADGGLASTGLADKAQHLALFKRQRDIFDDNDILGRFAGRIDGRFYPQVSDVEEWVSHRGLLSGRRCGSAPSPPQD